MNCFEFRRLILADPRHRTGEQAEHLANCASCSALAREMETFEAAIQDAVSVPVPDGLDERVLLRRRLRSSTRSGLWALAAAIVLALGIGAFFHGEFGAGDERPVPAVALGERNPAVAAISYVLDHEPKLLRETPPLDPAAVHQALAQLGLKLPESVRMRYLGKCPVPGGEGEHVVLETSFGRVTLILVPDQSMTPRILVADREMTALAAPARAGSYILVTDSIEKARRAERLLL